MSEYLDAVQARIDAATEGPWSWASHITADGDEWAVFDAEDHALASNHDGWSPDAEFIAQARTDLPRLLAAVRAVEAVLDDAENTATRNLSRNFAGKPFTPALADEIRRALTKALEGER